MAFAKRRPKARMLYLVLNKTVQIEAQQKISGTLVKPVTSHGLAFRQCGVQYQHKLVGGIKPYEVEKALQLGAELSREIGYSANFNDNMVIASLMLETLNKFLYSTDREIKIKHVPEHSKRLLKTFGGLGMNESAIQQMLVILVRRLWDKMIDPQDHSVGMLHDGYLKLYQLSDPVLSQYEYVKVDESQDINPVSMSIIFRQTAKKVLVGDEHQAIYGWRGARNALGFALKQGGVNRYLTGSFRFGPNIAYVANRILAIKGETIPVQGLSGQDWIGKIAECE